MTEKTEETEKAIELIEQEVADRGADPAAASICALVSEELLRYLLHAENTKVRIRVRGKKEPYVEILAEGTSITDPSLADWTMPEDEEERINAEIVRLYDSYEKMMEENHQPATC